MSVARIAPPDMITVLLADDDSGVCTFARQVLRGLGFTVLHAADGPGALAAALAHSGPIDLLVTDIMMPGFGGGELARRLTALHPDLKVLYLSGYSERDVQHLMQRRAAFLDKPFFASDLQRKIRMLLDRQEPNL